MRKGTVELDILDYYKKLVDFLGEGVLGENAEVVLRDCRKPDHDIIAIANGHVSGRTIGAPITDFTLSILANEEWKEKDYVVNYEGKAALISGCVLRRILSGRKGNWWDSSVSILT